MRERPGRRRSQMEIRRGARRSRFPSLRIRWSRRDPSACAGRPRRTQPKPFTNADRFQEKHTPHTPDMLRSLASSRCLGLSRRTGSVSGLSINRCLKNSLRTPVGRARSLPSRERRSNAAAVAQYRIVPSPPQFSAFRSADQFCPNLHRRVTPHRLEVHDEREAVHEERSANKLVRRGIGRGENMKRITERVLRGGALHDQGA